MAFKQALESAMKGQGPLPLIEIAQDASSITAAAAAIAGSSNLLTCSQQQQQIQQQQHAGASCVEAVAAGALPDNTGRQRSAAAAAATSHQLFAKGGWMEVFRGKLGKAAAKLAGPAAAIQTAGCSSENALDPGDTQALTSRDLLEVLGVRSGQPSVAAGQVPGAVVHNGEGSGDTETFEDAHSDVDVAEAAGSQLVSCRELSSFRLSVGAAMCGGKCSSAVAVGDLGPVTSFIK